MKYILQNKFQQGFAGILMAFIWALLMSACGGGGGSPGSSANGTPPANSQPEAKASSIIITTSSDELPTAGGAVTITVLVKDSINNVVPNALTSIKVDSGNLVLTNADSKTGTDGTLSATLTTTGDERERAITITAVVGAVAPVTKVVRVVASRPTLRLTGSSAVLDSSGGAGGEVTITAVVRDAGNNVLKNVPVTLSADSGALSVTNRTTNEQGIVTEKLSTGNDPTARTITVTASAKDTLTQTLAIQVAGHRIQISADDSANIKKLSKISATLQDSNGKPIANTLMTFTSKSNAAGLMVAGSSSAGSTATTDAQGQIQLDYTPTVVPEGGSDMITISALGVSNAKSIIINSLDFEVTPSVVTSNINLCVPFKAKLSSALTDPATVSMNSSRGVVYIDAGCSNPLNSVLSIPASGEVVAYVKATTPGVATIVANLQGGATASATAELEFVAPLAPTSHISLQVEPSVVGTGKPATLKAIVRDGTALDNLVKDATVVFSIVNDPSGGRLAQPSVIKTGSDGSATVVYTGGATTTAVGGVLLQASIQGIASSNGKNPATAAMTVSGQALFISAGTGNTIDTPSTTTYTVDYAVIVTDATGNAVPNATVVAKVVPRKYMKGFMVYNTDRNYWEPVYSDNPCDNEDVNRNGLLDSGEDFNASGDLDPGIPVTVTSSEVTDTTGVAKITLRYQRDRAYWTNIDMTITARVVGTEATYVTNTTLSGLSTDYSKKEVTPPGEVSPYGKNLCSQKD